MDFRKPVDWRPREHNEAANHVAICVLDNCGDIDTLLLARLRKYFLSMFALQVFSDWVFASNQGAAGVAFHHIEEVGSGFNLVHVGALGQYLRPACFASRHKSQRLIWQRRYSWNLLKG